ncbi:GLPGLI family protein [Chitinophaga nivalis]|uniref:GLPGLI family protein n=1 Tax=Chitinophaga nivalis TaxID=2991709 RepID=A0ABT3IKP6_9BACT|nr:GLPGLI family protein [Chitinophaga nivalis]MCW3465818.1 GLPGLI family protein [Chitinophaga nivalis]MCW3484491.1 GLPGLI family protein [Chitinophaga nivalis]
MKKMVLTGSLMLGLLAASGQQQQGRVVYERTMQVQARLKGLGAGGEDRILPNTRRDKLEVLFGNNQSLQRTLEEETPEDPGGGENGIQIRFVAAGASDVTFMDFGRNRKVTQQELAGKNYLLTDTISRMHWKLTGETRTILNYPCQQAITREISKRSALTLIDGTMKNETITDTATVTVWFTPAIPVSAGPAFQGQLPGLILAIDINDGKTVYQATTFTDQIKLTDIREPVKGKQVTQAVFEQEREKMIREMMRNNPAGRTTSH